MDDPLTIRWDASMGCYRVNRPNFASDGKPVSVVPLDDLPYETEYELAQEIRRLREALMRICGPQGGGGCVRCSAITIARDALSDAS